MGFARFYWKIPDYGGIFLPVTWTWKWVMCDLSDVFCVVCLIFVIMAQPMNDHSASNASYQWWCCFISFSWFHWLLRRLCRPENLERHFIGASHVNFNRNRHPLMSVIWVWPWTIWTNHFLPNFFKVCEVLAMKAPTVWLKTMGANGLNHWTNWTSNYKFKGCVVSHLPPRQFCFPEQLSVSLSLGEWSGRPFCVGLLTQTNAPMKQRTVLLWFLQFISQCKRPPPNNGEALSCRLEKIV